MATSESKRVAGRRSYHTLKKTVLLYYTPVGPGIHHIPRCADCQEDDLDVLTLHHIHGKGNQDRAQYGWGSKFFYSLQARHYPEGFEVLCANCSLKRHKNNKAS